MFERVVFTTAAASLLAAVNAQQPQQIPFNTSASAGPDGPWNFITLQVGSGPSSAVDFYPMLSNQASLLVADTVCKSGGDGQCLTPPPDYYNSAATSASNNPQNIVTGQMDVKQYDGGLSDQLSWTGNGHYWADTIGSVKADNVSFFVATDITQKDGNKSYNPLSLLSLEPNTGNNQVKTSKGNATTNTILESFTNSTKGAATSFALHIGSAAFNQSGSLYLGGYDPSRIIEKPAVFPHLGYVRLNTISLGTSKGLSPWADTTNLPHDFLGKPADVILSPHVPHIYLAQDVCNLMAQYLPIQYDNDTNLYLWNTSSQAYHDIVSSPSYLNFTFGDAASTSIRVPFALLNLTMTAPLKDKPTQYFPCSGRPNVWNLGRAFLQSAMLMQSYGHDYVYIAQAPGPSFKGTGTGPSLVSSANPTMAPLTNAPIWEDTWKDILNPLGFTPSLGSGTLSGGGNSPSSSSSGSSSSTSSTPLSGGGIAGVIIGVLGGITLIIAAIFFSLRYRRQNFAPVSLRYQGSGGGDHSSYISARPSLADAARSRSVGSLPPHYSTGSFVAGGKEKMLSPTQSFHSAFSAGFASPPIPAAYKKVTSPSVPGVYSQVTSPQPIRRELSRGGGAGYPPIHEMNSEEDITPMMPVAAYRGRQDSFELDPRQLPHAQVEGTYTPNMPAAYRGRQDSFELDAGPGAEGTITPMMPAAVRGRQDSFELEARSQAHAHANANANVNVEKRYELADHSWGPAEMSVSRFSMAKF